MSKEHVAVVVMCVNYCLCPRGGGRIIEDDCE